MESPKAAATVSYNLTLPESKVLLAFFEEKADEFRKMMAHGPISIEMQSGKIISIFTYSDFLDCLVQLRSGATSIKL